MPLKYQKMTTETVASTAEQLQKAAEQFAHVAFEMQQHALNEAYFPWTRHQWACIDAAATLAENCVRCLSVQLSAKAQNRPSKYEIMQIKSQRDMAARKIRNEKSADTPPKPRGRPRKNKDA